MIYDIAIIGGGICGSLIAYELSKYDLKVLLLEKENDLCQGATGSNSAMVHSGHDPKSGSKKAYYNLLGNRMFPSLCQDLQVPYKQIGAFVVATNIQEEERLQLLVNNCLERNIPFELLDGDKARELENNLSDNITKALYLPTTGIITPWIVSIAAMEEALLNQVELRLNYEVKSIEKNDYFLINKQIEAKIVINSAGVYCDNITNMLRKSPYQVLPRKGEYYVLDHLPNYVKHVIYPVPTEKGKGVLAVPTIHGNILLGPNSEFQDNKDDASTGEGLNYIKNQITKTMKNIPMNKMIHTFAGLRAHINLDDFYIQEDDLVANFIHVAGIESPGLSSAPAIAKDVVENMVLPKFEDVKRKVNYQKRKPFIQMNEMTFEQQNELIKKDKDFGKIICQCEKVSLGEIKDVINRKCGATTLKGVRLRCRPGMGRCQGGFCGPEVLKILSENLNIPISEVEQDKKDSFIYMSADKENL